MLSVRNLAGLEEPFIDFKGLRRKRKVNGEKTISLTIFNSKSNEHAFDLIEEESTIFFDNDEYVIKVMSERSLGKTTVKNVEAVHKFYVDLINKQQPLIHNGSITFQDYMEMVFEGTGYTFIAIDPFYARSFENLGDDNRLALLKKGLERFKAEMELVGNQVRFRQRVGNDSDFQFRYGHNIKTIERRVDTTNLATVIRGKGDPELGIEEYYRSDNADIFGEIDAPSVSDERFKSNESLLEEMIGRLQDTPEFSITIDFIELRAAGYPYTIPNEGDSVFVIYEPMQDLMIDTRILEIEEDFDIELNPIKTNVTLANYKKSFAGTIFDNVSKQLKDIVDDDGVIRYSVLDEAVRIATEALKSAQTELIFENGIIARDKNDPNRLVLLNSEGIGISSDGGQTFREAITSDGFVLTAGAIGRLNANHIQVGPSTIFAENYDPSVVNQQLNEFEDYVDSSFKDGIIEETEAMAIEKYINSLNTEKQDIDSKYIIIYLNPNLTGAPKTNLLNSKITYNGAHENLIDAILLAIQDGKTTQQEKENVDAKFSTYRTALADLVSKLEEAIESMSDEMRGDISRQGTYIDQHGVYTGKVTANQVQTGSMKSENDVTSFNLNNGRLQFNHTDGSFTRIGLDGIRRHTSLDTRNYHYLFHAVSFIYGQSSSSPRWITLPSDFRNKNFKVYFAIADSMGAPSYNYSIQRFVCTVHPDHSIDYARARVPVIAYKSNTLMDGYAPEINSVQGVLFAIY